MPTTKTKRTTAKKRIAKRVKRLTWRGMHFTLPAAFPGTFLFDLAETEAAGSSGTAALRMLRSFVGVDGYATVRGAIENGDVRVEDLADLFKQIFARYDTKSGK